MADRRYPDRFRLNLRDPASFDIQWKRDQIITFDIVTWDGSQVDNQGVGIGQVIAKVRALPNQGAVALLERACTGGAAHQWHYDLAFTPDDFPSLSFDLGQPYRCLWLDLTIDGSKGFDPVLLPVFDGAGNAIFPLRVHQTMGVGA